MQLVASDAIYSWTVILGISFTRLLTQRAAVFRTKRLNLWVLCMSHMWTVFQRNSNSQGIGVILGRSSEWNTLLGAHSWEPDQKEIRNRRHSVSIALPVNVTEATLVKRENSKLAQHACEEGQRVVWNEARILEIESNSRSRKYKESTLMTCLKTPISQNSPDISRLVSPDQRWDDQS
jgi:hypothetical protein